jgi:SAM-dependent methyltransferase
MYNAVPNKASYLSAGETVARAVNSGITVLELEPKSVLDYGCGHGRVTRWLRHYWPNAEFGVADITPDQIAFCASEFRAEPFLIDRPAAEIELPRQYDLIWLGSIFTHLDESSWHTLFNRLETFVAPGGVLCFSFEGRTVYKTFEDGNLWGIQEKDMDGTKEMLAQYEKSGFGFLQQAETKLGIWG